MARFRKIKVSTWGDEKFRQLSPIPECGQGLWFWLLTNPETTSIPGLYRAGEAGQAEALGWTLKGFREAFREVSSKGMAKADWKARVIWVPKAIEHNPPESPNVVKSWKVPWSEIPECSLKVEAYSSLKAFIEGLGKGYREAFTECVKPLSTYPSPNQDQEQEQEQEYLISQPSPIGQSTQIESLFGAHRENGNGKPEPEPKASKRFVKPTVEEVAAHCLERANGIDAESFVAHYESNGWLVGRNKTPMKNWKAAIVTWEKNHSPPPSPASKVPTAEDKKHWNALDGGPGLTGYQPNGNQKS